MVNRIDPKGVIKIKQEGCYYSVTNNDALILNKYLGYKIYGVYKFKTGFPVNGLDTVLKKINKLGMDYDVIDKQENIVVSQRFSSNLYETIDLIEYYSMDIHSEKEKSKKQIKLSFKDKLKTYIDILQGLSQGYNIFTGEIIDNLDDELKGFCFEMAMYFDERLQSKVNKETAIPNHGHKWTAEEDKRLLDEYNNGKTVKELCQIFQRSSGSIRSRLLKFINFQ
ncbi:MAG: hypothetical protein IJW82_05575 [Clostridia bacterium]|nr:hypothetical protein [Clostridia bacterium]